MVFARWGDQALAKGKLTHLQLQKLARDRPGLIAAKKLQEMADVISDEGVPRRWKRHDTPACAKAYYLRVVKPEVGPSSVRALREIKTICHVLDHLATGRS